MKVSKIVFLFFIITGFQLSPIRGMSTTDREEQKIENMQSFINLTCNLHEEDQLELAILILSTISFLATNNLTREEQVEPFIYILEQIMDNPGVSAVSANVLRHVLLVLCSLAKNNLIKEDQAGSVIDILEQIMDNPDVSAVILSYVLLTLSFLVNNNLIKEDQVELVIDILEQIVYSRDFSDAETLPIFAETLHIYIVSWTLFYFANNNLIKEDQVELVTDILEQISDNLDVSDDVLRYVSRTLRYLARNNLIEEDQVELVRDISEQIDGNISDAAKCCSFCTIL